MNEPAAFSDVWKRSFELAWEAHLEGSNPIASVVTDASGTIIGWGKSAVRGAVTGCVVSRCEIAHAEVNALLKLDNRVYSEVHEFTLYATLEPCPVCFGAFYMSGIRRLAYAAKDKFGGSTNLLGTTPYLSRKPIVIDGPIEGLAEVSIFMNVYSDVHAGRDSAPVHALLAEDYPEVVAHAARLGESDRLSIGTERNFDVVLRRMTAAIADAQQS